MFHVLRSVNSYSDLDLEALVWAAFADLHLIPFRRLGTHCCRRYHHLQPHQTDQTDQRSDHTKALIPRQQFRRNFLVTNITTKSGV